MTPAEMKKDQSSERELSDAMAARALKPSNASDLRRDNSIADDSMVDLSAYRNNGYQPGRNWFIRAAWYFTSALVFESAWFPLNRFKAWLLRRFGATVGTQVVIKPQVTIKYPWRLTIGDGCWIGQRAWLDNLAEIRLGNNVCLSQGAYLCTGSHDYASKSFDLITRPIVVENGAWIAAKAIVLPGCQVGANAIIGAGAVVRGNIEPGAIMIGNPAKAIGIAAVLQRALNLRSCAKNVTIARIFRPSA